MAVTSIWRVNGWLGKVVVYVENPDKTTNPAFYENGDMSEQGCQGLDDVIAYAVNSRKTEQHKEESDVLERFVSGVNCYPATARSEMMSVKKRFGKEDGTIAYHGYQSFAPGEATPEIAHKIGMELAQRLWGDKYQVVVATHLDKANHLHNHFVMNTVSFVDGKKYFRSAKDYHDLQIHLNNVPTNLLNPSEAKDEPALGGLHTFYIEKMSDNILPKYQTGKSGQYGYDILVKLHRKDEKKNKSRQKGHNETQAQIGLGLGESGGAEGNRTPVRKQLGKNFSGRSLLFAFPFPGGNKHPTRIGSFIMRGMGKAYHTHVLRLNHTRARVSGTPGADGRLIRQPGQQ